VRMHSTRYFSSLPSRSGSFTGTGGGVVTGYFGSRTLVAGIGAKRVLSASPA
jgi:hypothetical protein